MLITGSLVAAIAGGRCSDTWYGGEESERNPDAEAEALKAKVHAGVAGGRGLTVLLAVAAGVALLVVVVAPVWAWVSGRY
ncbi:MULTISPECIES: hypothetical protein [Streptomyces]|uniref:hypothetical protein n=1 Tax=Streptomyces TaxID=1883 RepID=UPI0004C621FF|nr:MULTISPECIES: hypothetical protein [Streptomyces]